MSIEVVTLAHFSATDQETSSSSSHSRTRHAVFHSFLSDNRKYDAAMTPAHRRQIIQLFLKKKFLCAGVSTVWENTDGCVEHYRCATTLF